MREFLKKAFENMKENAKAQHEVDKAEFTAVKTESKAQWEEAKAMRNPERFQAAMQAEREEKIFIARERQAEAQTRINAARNEDENS